MSEYPDTVAKSMAWELRDEGVWLIVRETTKYSANSSSTSAASHWLDSEGLIDLAITALQLAGMFEAPVKQARTRLLAAARNATRDSLLSVIEELTEDPKEADKDG